MTINSKVVIDTTLILRYILPIYRQLLYTKKRYSVLQGGAGSGKSYAMAQIIVLSLLCNIHLNVLVFRKTNRSVKDSVFSLLKSIIYNWGVQEFFKFNNTMYQITYLPTGNTILFGGIDDVEKWKSVTAVTGDYGWAWMEEATQFTMDDFLQIDQRLRNPLVPARVFLSFNPIDERVWLKNKFIENPTYMQDIFYLKTTVLDNLYTVKNNPSYIENLDKKRLVNKNFHNIYFKGDWGHSDDVIFSNYEVVNKEVDYDDYKHIIAGMDFGFNHKNAIVITGIDKNGDVHILNELIHGSGTIGEFIKANEVKQVLDKKTLCWGDTGGGGRGGILEFQQAGYKVHPVKKGAGSVMDSIQYLQNRKIYINAQCSNFIKEIQGYRWRSLVDGTLLDEPVKSLDDLIDCLRYSIIEFIPSRREKSSFEVLDLKF